ncbi:protein O-linked-mannose beta-1,4-N-acetylglucosaminyltransferase 2-like [Glandiceps talaboti]
MHQIIYVLSGLLLGIASHSYFASVHNDDKSTSPSGCHDDSLPSNDRNYSQGCPTASLPDPDLSLEGSSMWCTGTNHTNRICKFRNLCYTPIHDSFVFFHGKHSIKDGLPKKRFDPALLDLNSISDHNTQYFNFVDLTTKDVSTFDIEFYHGTSLVFNRFNPDNLMHVLHDDLLPLFHTLNQLTSDDSHWFDLCTRIISIEGWKAGEYFQLYQLFTDYPVLLKSDFQREHGNPLLCFRTLFVGMSKSTVWYQYGFNKPQGPVDDIKITGTQIKHFSDFVRRRLNIRDEKDDSDEFIVILSRKINRLILNEAQLMFALIQEFGMKVITVSQETHTIKEQIHIVSKAFILIGVHGSLLSLSMFLPQDSIIIEIFPYAVNPENYTPYKTLASLPDMKLTYAAWRNTKLENTVTHPEYPAHLGGIHHLDSLTQQEIVKSTEVPVHLCCKDPHWLFRAYQDTIVDISSFVNTVQEAILEKQHSKQLDGVEVNQQLYPSKVRNLTCQVVNVQSNEYSSEDENADSTNQMIGLQLSWKPPWNLPYLETSDVKYEVWIEGSDDEDYTAWILPMTEYTFTKGIKQHTTYDVWVRCLINDNIIGPFASALFCNHQ